MTGVRLAACFLASTLLSAACAASSASTTEKLHLQIGYMPNVTHATALVGLERGIFDDHLGPDVVLKPQLFKSGGQAVPALLAGGLDVAYMGPAPAINGYVKSRGEAVAVVAGSALGGVQLVVQPGIEGADDLLGRRIVAPQYANSQDIALRTWLESRDVEARATGSGDVELVYMDNAQTLSAFRSGDVAAAWVPEPWASRLVMEAGGRVLVDEADLWPEGRFPATVLAVHPRLQREHPEVVERLVDAHLEATDYVRSNPHEARRIVGAEIERLTGAALPEDVLARSFSHLEFTDDPVPAAVRATAAHAIALGVLESSGIDGLLNLDVLNARRLAAGRAEIAVP